MWGEDLGRAEFDWERMRREEDDYLAVADYQPASIGEIMPALLARIEELARKLRKTPRDAKNWYREVYLKSEWWKDVREATVDRDNHRCRVCNSDRRIQVHHRSYANLWNENPEDLVTLCDDCHGLFHRNGKLAKPPEG